MRGFERRFELADHVVVRSASHADGLLTIELERRSPRSPEASPHRDRPIAAATPGRAREGPQGGLRRRDDRCLPTLRHQGVPAPWPCRPAVGFLHPLEVVKDGDLDAGAKREILAAWASDASAVEDRPTQRWLLGTPRRCRERGARRAAALWTP
jgi:hypothetical protein